MRRNNLLLVTGGGGGRLASGWGGEPAANNLFIVEQTVETWSNVRSKQFSSLYDQTSCEKISDVLCATKPLHTDGI